MFIESHSLQSYITKIMYTNMIGDGVNTNRGLIALFITHTKLHTTSHVWTKDTHTHTHTQQTRALILDIYVKYGLSEYLKIEEIKLRKAFNAKFEGNSLPKFIKVYLFFV